MEPSTSFILKEMVKLRVLLGAVIYRLQVVTLRPKQLKQCEKEVMKVSKSFQKCQSIIDSAESEERGSTKQEFPKLLETEVKDEKYKDQQTDVTQTHEPEKKCESVEEANTCDDNLSEHLPIKNGQDLEGSKTIKKNHTVVKPYSCSVCGVRFRVRSCLNDHMNTHTGSKPYLCNICGKGFAGRAGLFLHSKIHTKNYSHKCEACEKSFPTKQRLNDHLKSHSEERPYKCTFKNCSTIFKSEVSLKKHLKRTHGPKQYFCDICAKQFTRAASLRLHTQLHQGSYKHTCLQCNKTFRDGSRLRQHERVHKNIRPFVCTECGKAFHNKRILEEHIRIHTGDKPFKCEVCGRTFTQSATLGKHMKCHNGGTLGQGFETRAKKINNEIIPKQRSEKILICKQQTAFPEIGSGDNSASTDHTYLVVTNRESNAVNKFQPVVPSNMHSYSYATSNLNVSLTKTASETLVFEVNATQRLLPNSSTSETNTL